MAGELSRRTTGKLLATLPVLTMSMTSARAEVDRVARTDALGGTKALAFDTGGTLLDWHSGLRDALAAAGGRRGKARDWPMVANEYRRAIFELLSNAARGQSAAIDMEVVHRDALDKVLSAQGLDAFDAEDRREIRQKWHALEAWPDVRSALAQLRRRFVVSPLTILSVALVVDTARHNDLVWDAVISCEMIGAYKPKPEVYATAARWLGFHPSEIVMVAAHNFDLNAARGIGFKTAFIRRPAEWGPAGSPDPEPNPAVDFKANDLADLARQLGAV